MAIETEGSMRELVPAPDRQWNMLINGRLSGAAGGGLIESIDPATESVIGRIPSGAAEDVDAAVAAASEAFRAWRRIPAANRAEYVVQLADAIERHGDELAVLDTVDNGSPIAVMRQDYKKACAHLRYYAGLALQLRGDTIPTSTKGSIDFSVYEPFGVVGRIVPFNHPLMFAAQKIAAPLVAGNTVVVKPAVDTSMSALRMGELAAEIFPPGVVNIVSGPGVPVGERLVRHPDVRRIAFTGSVEVGQTILRNASEVGVKVISLELGGKNPIIVFSDADLQKAVQGAVRGMNFTWQGQSCGSTSRLYVHTSVFDDFVGELARAMDAMRVGDPLDPNTDVGPVVSRRQYEKVKRYIELGPQQPGVRFVTGGLAPASKGFFIRPTLFTIEDEAASTLACEEIFGPVLVAMRFDEYEDVIRRANALPYGLTASVWTKDMRTGLRAAGDLESGYVWVNTSSVHVLGAPFGGQKQSGLGREEGIEELYSYAQLKNVLIQYD